MKNHLKQIQLVVKFAASSVQWTHMNPWYNSVSMRKFQPRDPPPKQSKHLLHFLPCLFHFFALATMKNYWRPQVDLPENGGNSHDHIVPTSKKVSCSKILSTTETNAILETAVLIIVSTKKHHIAFKPTPCWNTFMLLSWYLAIVFQPKTSAQSFAPIVF